MMKRIVLNVFSVIFGLLLINGGLDKFFQYMPTPEDLNPQLIEDFEALGQVSWLFPLVGLAEIVGGILLLFPRTRALGALVVFPVMMGVLLTHIFSAPEGLHIAVVIWVILLWIIYDNRHKFLPLLD